MLTKMDIEKVYCLTPMQEGMLFHSIVEKEANSYFEQVSFEWIGDFSLEHLEKSFNHLFHKYDILRTIFIYEKLSKPQQVVLKNRKTNINFIDVTRYSEMEQKAFIEDFKNNDITKGFNLSKDILMRLTVIKIKDDVHQIILSFHHIILDGWSLGIVIKELFHMYSKVSKGEYLSRKFDSSMDFVNYIDWIQKQDRSNAFKYWKKYLAGIEHQTFLPGRRTNEQGSKKFNVFEFELTSELTRDLKEVSVKSGVSLNSVIQTIWGIMLQKYNQSHDAVFGTVISGRNTEIPEIEEMVGMFVNTLPIRVKDNHDTFKTLLLKTQNEAWERDMHGFLSIAEIQSQSNLKNNLLNHIMVFENHPLDNEVLNIERKEKILDYTIKNLKLFERTNYDLSVMVVPEEKIKFVIEYNTSTYQKDMINRIGHHYKHLTKQLLMNEDVYIEKVELITPDEKNEILNVFNKGIQEVTSYKSIQQKFEETVLKFPNSVALEYKDGSNIKKISYKELNSKANQLARFLKAEGLQQNQIAGVVMTQSPHAIVSILAILKAGGAYLPIDPAYYPASRLLNIIAESQPALILTCKDEISKSKLLNKGLKKHKTLFVDDIRCCDIQDGNLDNVNDSNDLAYVIYTSGTTGLPKGVMLRHKGVINLSSAMREPLQIKNKTKILQFASYSFDASVYEIFTALLNGACLFLVDRTDKRMLLELSDTMRKYHINVATLPPTVLKDISNESLPTLHTVVSAGESCTDDILEKWAKSRTFINAYGPTESTVCATYKRYEKANKNISIGRSINNSQVYILDKNKNLLPPGVIGCIYIGGVGLAKGYLHNPKLTTEKFIDNPYIKGEKMYCTGDLAKWSADGNIEFVGRKDHQIKMRGFRIEPQEIEYQIMQHRDIKEAAVIDIVLEDNSKQLWAFIVSREENDSQLLRDFLQDKLPDYMIPIRFYSLKRLPLTSNGKIDRNSLKEKYKKAIHERHKIEKPTKEMEKILYEIWKDVLKTEGMDINDDFIQVGGHSINAVQIMSRLQKKGIKLTIDDLYKYKTIKRLSNMLTASSVSNKIYNIYDAEKLLRKECDLNVYIKRINVKNKTRYIYFVDNHIAKENEVLAAIKKYISPEIQPHYIKFNKNNVDFGHEKWNEILELKSLTKDEVNFITDSCVNNNQLSAHFRKGEVIKTFPLSPIQRYHLDYSDYSGTIVFFNEICEISALKKAITIFVEKQELMRSMLRNRDGEYYWDVYSCEEHINIPFLDISEYNLDSQKELLKDILPKMFFSEYSNSLFYRILIIKVNEKEHILLFPFSHLKFDKMSSILIEKEIKSIYNSIEKNESLPTHNINLYSDYVKQVMKGPQLISDQEVNNIYDLNKMVSLHELISVPSNETRPVIYTLRKKIDHTQNHLETYLQICCSVLSKMLGIKDVPIFIIQHGRNTQDGNYFGTLGEFIDIFPFIWFETDTIESVNNRLNTRIAIKKNKNINFAALFYQQDIKSNFPKTNRNITKMLSEYPILFNYLDETKESDNEYNQLMKSNTPLNTGKRIIVEVNKNEEHLNFTFILPFRLKEITCDGVIESLVAQQGDTNEKL
ncbi:non-ribosomal peptide synthetase [Bacillus atrophaeus]|uniref:non-ribosomal peptide synthetase n=4 Tax=Bacillus atrophaeus TaxID=1452 RepID=UPI0022823C8D|nr:non-ribosomal peptide synthetase [Bacillus atrophaeus]MCY8517202.1 amino acid adenylation domain-containing protein [Bacillus atrophaeus]